MTALSDYGTIALSPNGKTAASGSTDGEMRLWNVEPRTVIAKWAGHADYVQSMCWSLHSKRVVSGSWNGTVTVWDIESRKIVLDPFETGHRRVFAVIYSSDTTKIATGGTIGGIKTWDANTGELRSTIEHKQSVWSLTWSSDQKKLISGSLHGSIRSFDTATSQRIVTQATLETKWYILVLLTYMQHFTRASLKSVPTTYRRTYLAMLDIEPMLYLATSALVLVSLSWGRKLWENRSRPPLPPGPPCLPLLGSILSLHDPVRPWLSFNALRSTYGDIIYARLLTKPVVVVNSEEIARDLFELRSTIYTDRPQSIVYEHFSLDFNMGLLPYGDRWRLHRRILHQQFHQAAIHTYHDDLLRSIHKMLFSILQDPTNYTSHIKMFTSSFILSIVYDYQPKSENDRIVRFMLKFLELAVTATGPGAAMVIGTFPFLLQLPAWFPGARFKRASVECLQAGHDMKEIPFQHVTDRMSNGQMPPCLVADTMNKMNGFENKVIENAVKEAASFAFAATNETTVGTMLVFLLAMVLHPEVQAKAQADIDRVIGKDRLPDFNDRPALPYVEAILRESLRWHPVFPMGVPHSTMTSDIYNGYFIPKGVIVIANTWAMTHDEEKYPNPDEFKPERFLHEDGSLTSDTMSLAFGWGRRICVGRHLAEAALWIAITSFLATFSVHKALDENGEEIPVIPKFLPGIAVHPETFPCQIVPRFKDASVERLTQLTRLVAEQS